jgi:peptidoglycan/xylan/chitin deacetylase (PgdA/CDA1 family)
MGIPVLTYHGVNVIDNSYQGNDHLALAADLLTIRELGFRVVPLNRVVDWHAGKLKDEDVSQTVAITFDDGSWFDFYDLEHPTCGLQRSMFNIIKDFNALDGTAHPAHATSFVIASPDARASLDKSCLVGKGWWGDEWWLEASRSGVMDVECHSWDHVHPNLGHVAQQDQAKGDFARVASYPDCTAQFAGASDYITSVLAGKRPALFAYPYGQASDYAVERYLPEHTPRHGFRAAFTTEPKPVTRLDNAWTLPRFVFGQDWRSPEGLRAILNQA